jgi:hypothetical protein
MVACPESLSLANVSNIIRSVASLELEASECDKDGEFLPKIEFLHFEHSYAMETVHWAYLFAVMDSPCAQLACLRWAHSYLLLLRS